MSSPMYYTYFKPVVKEEHFLFAGEIAKMFNIQTRTGKDADTFVSVYLQSVASKVKNYEQLLYCTRYGMAKVYPRSFYNTVMNDLILKIGYNEEVKIIINKKNYYIKVVR